MVSDAMQTLLVQIHLVLLPDSKMIQGCMGILKSKCWESPGNLVATVKLATSS